MLGGSIAKAGVIGGATFALYGSVKGQQAVLFPALPLPANDAKKSGFVGNAAVVAAVVGACTGIANGLAQVAWDQAALGPVRMVARSGVVPDAVIQGMAKNTHAAGSALANSAVFAGLFSSYELGKRSALAALGLNNTPQVCCAY